jgi:hypothetical protein
VTQPSLGSTIDSAQYLSFAKCSGLNHSLEHAVQQIVGPDVGRILGFLRLHGHVPIELSFLSVAALLLGVRADGRTTAERHDSRRLRDASFRARREPAGPAVASVGYR